MGTTSKITLAAAAAILMVEPLHATTYEYGFLGNPAAFTSLPPNIPGAEGYEGELFTTIPQSSSPNTPDVTLIRGDVLQGTIAFVNPITIPASQESGFYLTVGYINANLERYGIDGTMTFLDNGAHVNSYSGVSGFENAAGAIGFTNSVQPTFTFDEIQFSSTFETINDLPATTPTTFSGQAPEFDYFYVPVPLPAAAWLFVSGVGAMGLIARRRQAK